MIPNPATSPADNPVYDHQRVAELEAELARLRAVEQDYQSFLDASPDILWTANKTGKITRFSQRWLDLTGLDRSSALGDGWQQALHPEDLPASLTAWRHSVATGEPYSVEHRIRLKDGSFRWMCSQATAQRDSEGRIVRWHGRTKGIDDSQRPHPENAQHLQRLEQIAALMPDLVYLYDLREQRNVYANRELMTVLGYTAEQAQSLGADLFHRLIHPDDLPRALANIPSVMALPDGEFTELEYRMRHVDGSWRWLRGRDTVFAREPDGTPRLVLGVAQDVTERRRSEEALRSSQERFELAQQVGHVGTFEWDIKAGRTWISPNLLALGGFADGEWDGTMETWQRRVHPDDHAHIMSWLPGVFARRESEVDFDFRLVRLDGTTRWINGRGRIHYDEQGAPIRMLGVHLDLTERRQAEEALRTSESQLRQITDLLPQLVWVTKPDGNHEWFNGRWYEYTGATGEQSAGERWANFFHPDDVPEAQKRWAHSLATGDSYEVEYRCRRRDGVWRWFLGQAEPVRNASGAITRWLGTCTDIHDRKEAAEAVEHQRLWLEAILDWLPTPVLFLEPGSAKVWFANRAANQAAGGDLPKPDSKEQYEDVYRCWDADGQPIGQEQMPGVRLARGEELKRLEIDWQTPQGRLSLLVDGTTMPPLYGHPALCVYTFQDVTRLKQVERALRRSNEDLERFAYMAGHDLQEPLRMVTSYAQLLARRYRGQLDAAADEYLHYVLDGTKRMGRLIQDLLTYARAQSTQALELQLTDANAALNGALSNLQERIRKAQPILTQDRLPTLPAAEGPLTQVFQNLISNALKYARPGMTPEVHIGVQPQDSEWIFSVQDNGQGIAPEYREQIFRLFTRLHGRDVSGTGIGLATVKRIVERHGGRVWVKSEPGAGSTFFFSLPMNKEGHE